MFLGRIFFKLIPLLLLGLFFCGSLCAETATGKVSWIYDGDTLKVDGIGKVRLIGIDAPEKEDSPRDSYYLRHDQIGSETLRKVARQAFSFNMQNVKDRRIKLEFDREKTDDYGRTLAYVILPDGRMLNRLLIEKGFAAVYRRFNFQRKREFLQAEKSARDQRLGLWHK
jgi:micrococcal nuclease